MRRDRADITALTRRLNESSASGSSSARPSALDAGGGAITDIATDPPITGGGGGPSVTIGHSNTAVAPGSYTNANITVDQTGHVTAAANGSATPPALSVVTKTAAYTVTDSDDVILVDCTAGPVTITLHAVATARKKRYAVVKTDASANALTVDGNGAELVNGAASVSTSTQFGGFDLVPDGAAWYVVP